LIGRATEVLSRLRQRGAASAKIIAVVALVVVDVALFVLLYARNTDRGRASDSPADSSQRSSSNTPSDNPSASPSTEPPTTSPPRPLTFRLATRSTSAGEPVAVSGRYAGVVPGTSLLLERRGDGRWRPFPVPAVTRAGGDYSSIVQLMQPGRYQLRAHDPVRLVSSPVVTLRIR
jgi:hypothetical protein